MLPIPQLCRCLQAVSQSPSLSEASRQSTKALDPLEGRLTDLRNLPRLPSTSADFNLPAPRRKLEVRLKQLAALAEDHDKLTNGESISSNPETPRDLDKGKGRAIEPQVSYPTPLTSH